MWSYDFVQDRTADGRAFRTLNILDEFSRECLAIRVDRKLNSVNVIDALTDLFIRDGPRILDRLLRWIEPEKGTIHGEQKLAITH